MPASSTCSLSRAVGNARRAVTTRWACSSLPSASIARGRDHARQFGLQHEPTDLPRTKGCDGIAAPEIRKAAQRRQHGATKDILDVESGADCKYSLSSER
jgi:hypothetical protein